MATPASESDLLRRATLRWCASYSETELCQLVEARLLLDADPLTVVKTSMVDVDMQIVERKRMPYPLAEFIVITHDAGVTYRTIAIAMGSHYRTCQDRYSKYAKKRQLGADASIEACREELTGRYENLVTTALSRVPEATNLDAARLIAEARQAMAAIGKLKGVDAPQKVEHTGTVTATSPLDMVLQRIGALTEASAPSENDEDDTTTEG